MIEASQSTAFNFDDCLPHVKPPEISPSWINMDLSYNSQTQIMLKVDPKIMNFESSLSTALDPMGLTQPGFELHL